MSKVLLSAVLLLLGNNAIAQFNLQLNQVLLVGSTTQTVPAGKVWKIESYMQAGVTINEMVESTASCNFPGRHHAMIVNNQLYYLINGSPGHGSSGTYMAVGNTLPMWIPAGTTLRSSCSSDVISVLEFNLTP
ncbi:MAG: hypothetical protein EB023_07920 [Flavobacteriia bacterium]|nr:hypothetical protein [Flavobacteriia bacterium]